jgi:hypothetical protein
MPFDLGIINIIISVLTFLMTPEQPETINLLSIMYFVAMKYGLLFLLPTCFGY